MIKVVAKFKEKFWDKEANAEIPMDTIYMGEALSVESQKDGMNVQQKFNGHNNGIFLKYKDMSVLQLDDATIDDFKDLDALEAACVTANATKKITFVGANFKVAESAEATPDDPEDIDITSCFKKDGKVEDKVIFLEADEDYEIREVSVENAEVTVKRVEVITPAHDGLPATSEDMIQATVHGMQGNVVMSIVTAAVPEEEPVPEPTPTPTEKIKVTLAIAASATEAITAVDPATKEVEVDKGGDATFTITKASGATGTFSVDKGTISGTTITLTGVSEATTITVSYAAPVVKHTVNVTIDSSATSYVTCEEASKEVVDGEDVTFTITNSASTGTVSVDNGTISGDTITLANVTADTTITVSWSDQT